jgi:hypothetical protein
VVGTHLDPGGPGENHSMYVHLVHSVLAELVPRMALVGGGGTTSYRGSTYGRRLDSSFLLCHSPLRLSVSQLCPLCCGDWAVLLEDEVCAVSVEHPCGCWAVVSPSSK